METKTAVRLVHDLQLRLAFAAAEAERRRGGAEGQRNGAEKPSPQRRGRGLRRNRA